MEEALPFLIGERTGDTLLRQRDQPVETDTQVAAVDEALTGARPERAGVPGVYDQFTIGREIDRIAGPFSRPRWRSTRCPSAVSQILNAPSSSEVLASHRESGLNLAARTTPDEPVNPVRTCRSSHP